MRYFFINIKKFKIFLSLFCVLFILGCGEQKKEDLLFSAEGKWNYVHNVELDSVKNFFEGGGPLDIRVDNNGVMSGEFSGSIEEKFRCLKKEGCFSFETGTQESIEKALQGDQEMIPYNQPILKHKTLLVGSITGRYANEDLIYPVLVVKIIDDAGITRDERYRLKGKVKDGYIEGFFNEEGRLDKSGWYMEIL